MFEFIHEIIEAWILKATSEGLSRFKMGLVQSHLKQCGRCRSFALDLVEFSHSLEATKNTPKLPTSDREEIHARVMAAFERERLDERMTPRRFERAAGPLVRPGFLQVLALVLLVIGALFVLSIPYLESQPNSSSEVSASTAMSDGQRAVQAMQTVPSLSPVPSPSKNSDLIQPIASPTSPEQ